MGRVSLRFAAGHNLGREKPVNADLLPAFLALAVISQAAVTSLVSLKRGPINADSLGENLVFRKSADVK